MQLENHLGMSDKTLAEFVIDLVRGSASCAAFLASIKADELPLPAALAENLYRLVQTMAPRKMKQQASGKPTAVDKGKKHQIGADEQLTAADIVGVAVAEEEERQRDQESKAKAAASSDRHDREIDRRRESTTSRRHDGDRYGRDRSRGRDEDRG
ncbi:hypothetical protein BBJ28_00018207 [Nothophytophthora sp. Chile5]|nr:hypothetical protein BBJ28_00018207 [Nothophytophthora sp. Chile5]